MSSEVLRAFLGLGLTAFGGPVAHLAHFRRELVERRRWLEESDYARLVAYCQVLPGPTSSQVGFLLGWRRAGLAGAAAAWLGFTLPSAAALATAALALGRLDTAGAWLAGMKAAVLAVVAQAVLGMARSLCPDARHASIAAGVAIVCLLAPGAWSPLAALGAAGLCGLLPGPPVPSAAAPGRIPGWATTWLCLGALALAVAGAAAACWLAPGPLATLAATCLRAGGLVFGGGHVVLPLLRDPLVAGGLVGDGQFLAGYGAAQAVPGPLFTVAAWAGALVAGWLGALVAVLAIFAPGLLLALGALRFHQGLLARPAAGRTVAALNAGVVGLLGAALWDPIGREAAHAALGIPLALAAFVALHCWRAPAWAVVAACSALAAALGAWA